MSGHVSSGKPIDAESGVAVTTPNASSVPSIPPGDSSSIPHTPDGKIEGSRPGLKQPATTFAVPAVSGLDYTHSSTPPKATADAAPRILQTRWRTRALVIWTRAFRIMRKFFVFIGPGAMVSVSYIDPGNYSTGISAGASFRFDLLCVVLFANILAIFLQSLSLRLGTVTGRDLAQNCRDHLPRWLNLVIYVFAEAAIVATDLAEVIGTAIALNILSRGKIPLVAGVALTMLDVLIILAFYNRSGTSLRKTQIFEMSVGVLVLGVAVCFSVELSKIRDTAVGEVFKGYLPSKTIVQDEGLYLACGILGATVMPHSLFLGSGLVQTRLRDYDFRHGHYAPPLYPTSQNASISFASADTPPTALQIEMEDAKYRPSLYAIRNSLPYSLAELIFSLLTFALYINSAILIVAGATLYQTPGADDADLFSIYDLMKEQLSTAAATIFALALLFSGQSAGLVVTLAGQMVSEGFLQWNITPWKRRLFTRGIAVIPCIVVAGAVGRTGLSEVLNASQVALSIILPFVTAPLIWFTCKAGVMSVRDPSVPSRVSTPVGVTGASTGDTNPSAGVVDFSNGWFTTILAVLIWLFISGLNVYLVVTLAMGKAS